MVGYYEYETSPRKTYDSTREIKENAKKVRAIKTKVNSKSNQIRKTAKAIVAIGFIFAILLLISYRYALINTKLSEKENLKSQLLELEKQNTQLQVMIEQGMNISEIEQEAKEKLGMQKLDNSQKNYVCLDKKDYVESSSIANRSNDSWLDKLIKTLKGE